MDWPLMPVLFALPFARSLGRSNRMYQVRRVHIGKTAELDELAHECGVLYSQTLVFFWRTVRHQGIWLKEKHLKRLFTSKKLHAHTADACVEAFFCQSQKLAQAEES